MNYYDVNTKKQAKVYKNYIKKNLKNSKWLSKVSYFLEKLMFALAAVLGTLNIVNVIFFSHEPLYLFFLIMTVGFPFGISLIFKTIYSSLILKEFDFRDREIIGIENNTIQYFYIDSLFGDLYQYIIPLDSCSITYDSKLKLYKATGDIKCIITDNENPTIKETVSEVQFLDIFDAPLSQFIDNHKSGI